MSGTGNRRHATRCRRGVGHVAAQSSTRREGQELCPGRVAYYFCGFWPIPQEERDPHTQYWSALPRPLGRVAVAALQRQRRARPQLQHVACVSQFVLDTYRRYGRVDSDARVIYGGTQIGTFYRDLEAAGQNVDRREPLRLLFAGSVSPQKGADTIVQAMARLSGRYVPGQVQLTLVGGGHPKFVEHLQQFVRSAGLEPYVTFQSRVTKDQMPAVLQTHDVLLFASTWQEPLARMMLEGMAAGLALVSTTTGGSGEAIEHEVNGLEFVAGDADDLVRQIERLLNEPGLVQRLAWSGQQTAIARFNFARMADELEHFFTDAVHGAVSSNS